MDTVLSGTAKTFTDAETIKHDAIPGFFRVMHGVLSPEECAQIVHMAENKGFEKAALYTDNAGRDHFSDTRKSLRCIIDSFGFTEELWRRVEAVVPPAWHTAGQTAVGLNERLRILKYHPGDEFKMHSDGAYTAPNGDSSKITLLIYLNEGYEGGFTHYSSYEGMIAVVPKIGAVVLQDQALGHCVPPLQKGVKYALRTEVMYRPIPTGQTEFREFTVKL
jgi:hypothetical protein